MTTKFAVNVKQFAQDHNMSLDEASEIIQTALFKDGYVWQSGSSTVKNTDFEIIYAEANKRILGGSEEWYTEYEKDEYPFAEIVTVTIKQPTVKTFSLNGNYTKEELMNIIKENS